MNILIVGASRGVGKHIALNYATKGNNLILIARNEESLKEVQDKCQKTGVGSIGYFPCDVTNTKNLSDILQKILSKHPIDLCIYAAGITSLINNNEFEDLYHCDKLLKTNLNGAITVTNYLLPKMLERNIGHIVYFSSLASYYGMGYSPSYCASKAGIRVYAESVRQYCYKTNINISVITMGFVKSNMSEQFIRPKPFLISTEKAARYIYKKINARKAYIRFPFILQIAIRIQSILPYKIADWFMIKSGYGRK
ncbi:SDR family NAD(P)-dependent oxidoreductase [Francisella uliginis]|uniref:Short-chain dehydrogenase n=1 Tax=Francisella uliginis TaxID=573570 RepID=A0A1L4BU60_9GAMM|nr:SDR family NAD(P)-dependent oxidoreductase [Francisella uliginis]API87383.1 short-chain dehydrogenase [Francisella uliginis]